MQKRSIIHATAIAAALVAFAAALTAWSGPAAAYPYGDMIKACDEDNAREPGSCQKVQDNIGVLHGCAGNACFACPTDGRRKCYPATDSAAGGVIHGQKDIMLSPDGTSYDELVTACDQNANGGGNCNYAVDTLLVEQGKSVKTGSQYQCIDKKECHRLN